MSAESLPLASVALDDGWLSGPRARWQRRYALTLLGLDLAVLLVVTVVGVVARFGVEPNADGLPYGGLAVLITLTWAGCLAVTRSYESRVIPGRAEELLRVLRATVEAFAAVSLVAFLTKAGVSRLYVLTVFPLGLVMLLADRFVVHRMLAKARSRGQAQHAVLVVGEPAASAAVARAFAGEHTRDHRIAGFCLPTSGDAADLIEFSVPVSHGLESIREAVRASGADTVAVTAGPWVTPDVLSGLCYDLEGFGVDVLVAPSLAQNAGTRTSIRPVAGLPLLHVDEPELDGAHKLVKSLFDRVAVTLGMLLISPVLIGLWAAVRFTSPGGAIFKQDRVGRDGQVFKVWKFRSMYMDAEARLAELEHLNEGGGPLFKMKNDPRVTPIGRFIRKWSLDELPQLVNVLKGDMSLVGPRPPLPKEVLQYEGHAARRLLVKPGITGLWQVSGRSDLDWDQTVRLDLSYVDNWSLGLDIAILARTAVAVVRSSGAY